MTGIQHIQSWSGGKDSTASIVLENLHRDELKIPPSKVVMAELMFDIERGISGEYPDHIEWVYTYAKPLLESWGHEVEIVRSNRDYVGIFRRVIERVTVPENEWRTENLVSPYFKYDMTFWDVAAAVEQYLAMPEQLSLF